MKNSNQAAFPTDNDPSIGVTKREFFAAMAMQGMVNGFMKKKVNLDDIDEPVRICAQWSIKFADELLKQLGND
jgi:cysteine synthase